MSPVFAHGQLRLYLLSMLADGPLHGYEVIRDLQDRFHGLYTPSAGTIYPRLAKLEAEGLVIRHAEGRKTLYALTDAGRREVAERQGDLTDLDADLDRSVRDLADAVRSRVHEDAQDLRGQLRAAAQEARRTARPASGHSDTAPPSPVDQQLAELRRSVRQAIKHHADESTRSQIAAVIADAQRRIDELLHR